jgi:hypothetical protein
MLAMEEQAVNIDTADYFRFTRKSRFDKALNTLRGILYGISMDGCISSRETDLLNKWVGEHYEFRYKHPFNELIPVLSTALSDGVLEQDEVLDLKWICEKLTSKQYYDDVTADMQCLHGMLGGILADGIINHAELNELLSWTEEKRHLSGLWPFDEVESLVTAVLADGKVEEGELEALKEFFSDFVGAVSAPGEGSQLAGLRNTEPIQGLCAICPNIKFENSAFCFTGASSKFSRKELANIVQRAKGTMCNTVTMSLDYLVVCANQNSCWAYACYGRKVEQAMELRKRGHELQIVHELDFLDSIADAHV